MKILKAAQIREADAFTIEHEPIASIDLMERAATRCFEWMQQHIKATSYVVVCGTGNNGGDGLVMARLLYEAGHKVTVIAVRFSDGASEDFQVNEKRLLALGVPIADVHAIEELPEWEEGAVMVDAIFGTGLTRPAEGVAADVIQAINKSSSTVVAIDMPSGLFDEDNSTNKGAITHAQYTLTFEVPKLALLFPSNSNYVGKWEVIPIGLNAEFMADTPTTNHYLTGTLLQQLLQQRSKYSHKGTYGHALLISGSKGKMGATILAARACMRSGVGLLTIHAPAIGYEVLQTAVPEAMCLVDEETDYITEVKPLNSYKAIGIGPGMGMDIQTQNALKRLIQETPIPLVIDADAINAIAENKTWAAFLPAYSIFTPHPKEFERLVGKWESDYERHQLQREFARKNNVYVVLKGANTAVASPDGQVFFNTTGNPGMATGGSGDVLTGIITGLLAQGYSSLHACLLGVFLHGLAGDLAAMNGMESLIASDIVDHIGPAFKVLRDNQSDG